MKLNIFLLLVVLGDLKVPIQNQKIDNTGFKIENRNCHSVISFSIAEFNLIL